MKQDMLKKLLYWMQERQRIYLKRQAGDPLPWTKDPILKKYRFCNVYREQDRVTQWIQENWRETYAQHENLWIAMCMARLINWPDTLAEIGFPEKWNPKQILRVMEKRRARGEKVYTGAYMLNSSKGSRNKPYHTVNRVLNPLWRAYQKQPIVWDTLENAFNQLNGFFGMGRFLAYEAITDLRHTCYLQDAPDIMTWANVGPGAKRGLNRIFGRLLEQSQPVGILLGELLEVMDWIILKRDQTLLPTVEARDIEMSLCEFDKYQRAGDREKDGQRCGLEVFQRRLAI